MIALKYILNTSIQYTKIVSIGVLGKHGAYVWGITINHPKTSTLYTKFHDGGVVYIGGHGNHGFVINVGAQLQPSATPRPPIGMVC